MYNIKKVNKNDVAKTHEELSEVINCLDALQSRMYSVEENEMADLDSAFLHSVIKWIETKQKYILAMNDLTEDDLVNMLEG